MASRKPRRNTTKRRYLTDTDNPSIPKTSRRRWLETEVLPFEGEGSNFQSDNFNGAGEESISDDNGVAITTTTTAESDTEIENEQISSLNSAVNGSLPNSDAEAEEQQQNDVNDNVVSRQDELFVENRESRVSFDPYYFLPDTEEETVHQSEEGADAEFSENDATDNEADQPTQEDNTEELFNIHNADPDIPSAEEPDILPDDDREDIPSCDQPDIPSADECLYENCDITKGQAIVTLLTFILRHHLTSAAVGDLLEMLEIFFPGTFPSSKFLLAKGVMGEDDYYDAHLFCPVCDIYLGKFSDCQDLDQCQSCNETLDREGCLMNGHFFLYISIEKQLRRLLKRHSLAKKSDVIEQEDLTGAFSGKVLKEHYFRGEISDTDITLLWNCDGAPVFRSSKRAVWPLQACINEIPVDHKDNCLLMGLWFAKQKPWSHCYLKPFVDELKYLGTVGMKWTNKRNEQIHSKVYSVCSSCDSCARPMFRNATQFNGRHGCDWCLQEGEVIERGDGISRIYRPCDDAPVKRTLSGFLDDSMNSSETNPVNGVRGVSPLVFLPMFNIVRGFVPDYLHCVLLGVVRMFAGLWFDSKNHQQPWYIGQRTSELSRKLVNMKPPSNISRLPRALSERKFWKGSEWKSFLLYYSLIILHGTLPQQFLNHWFLLVFSINILLQDRISLADVEMAERSLHCFVKDVPSLYGREYCTFNVHQLLHLSDAVRDWGPLWVFSCFRFEGNIGQILALVRGTKCVPMQICKTFLLQTHLPTLHDKYFTVCDLQLNSFFNRLMCSGTYVRRKSVVVDNVHLYGSSRSQELDPAESLAVSQLYGEDPRILMCQVYKRFSWNSMYVCTLEYKQSNRYCDDTIQLQNGNIYVIKRCIVGNFFCSCESDCSGSCKRVLLLVNLLETSNDRPLANNQNLHISSDRFFTIGTQSLVTLCIEPPMLLRKCFRFQKGGKHYVVPLPTCQELDK